jgi:hypothetical protein
LGCGSGGSWHVWKDSERDPLAVSNESSLTLRLGIICEGLLEEWFVERFSIY